MIDINKLRKLGFKNTMPYVFKKRIGSVHICIAFNEFYEIDLKHSGVQTNGYFYINNVDDMALLNASFIEYRIILQILGIKYE